MFIVAFREHGRMNMATAYIGPFEDYDSAYEYLCALPALDNCPPGENPGVKFISELIRPDVEIDEMLKTKF